MQMVKHFATDTFRTLLIYMVAGLSIAGCSEQNSAGIADEGPAGIEMSALEKARIGKFLDEQYKRSDVRHGFKTRFDEEIDCVDADAQPALRGSGLNYDNTLTPPAAATPSDPSILPGGPAAFDRLFA